MNRVAALHLLLALALGVLCAAGPAFGGEKKSPDEQLREDFKTHAADEKLFNENIKGLLRLAEDEADKPYPKVCGSLTGSTGSFMLVALDQAMRKSLLAYNNTEVSMLGKVLVKEDGKYLIVSEIIVATNPGRDRRKRGGL